MTTTRSGREGLAPGLTVPCTHPPARLYTGTATDYTRDTEGHWQAEPVFWVACCQCGAVLKGGWQPDAHSNADTPIHTEHCTHSRTPTPRNTVGSCGQHGVMCLPWHHAKTKRGVM